MLGSLEVFGQDGTRYGDRVDPAHTAHTSQQEPAAVSSLAAIAALSDESRRRMYGFIRQARRPVSREEAAASIGISRKLAAFHLDKLVEVGLLRATYQPLSGSRKVGRKPKVYEPTEATVQISIPDRQHHLLAEILLEAILGHANGESAQQAALRVATQRGVDLGAAERECLRPGRLSAERALTLTGHILARYGFEPDRESSTRMQLCNCPFHPLATKAPHLVCGINHAFLTGFLTGLQVTTVQAVLAPHPPQCCVQLCSNRPPTQ